MVPVCLLAGFSAMSGETRAPSVLDRFRERFRPGSRAGEKIFEHDPAAEPGQAVERPRILLVSSDRAIAASVLDLCEDANWPIRVVIDPTSWSPADDWNPSVALLEERGEDLGPLIERLHQVDEDLAIVALDAAGTTPVTSRHSAISGVIRLPLKREELRTRILGFQAHRPPAAAISRRGRLIVVCGSAGGVGTSTVATNLAAALGWIGARTDGTMCALVDGSLHFADQRVLLDIAPDAAGLVEVAASLTTREALHSTLIRYEPGLMVLAGPNSPESGEGIVGARFGEILKALSSLYPFTVVDIGRELTESTFLAFDLADEIVLVTTLEVIALKNARLMLDLLGQLGRTPAKVRLVLNRVGERAGLSPTEATGIFEHPFEAQLPDDVSTTNYALVHGRPFTLDRRETALARAVIALASLFTKPGSNRQLDLLKARGFPKGLTDLFLAPESGQLDAIEPAAEPGEPFDHPI
jgi:pilus assembly protein CpaE